MIGFFPDPGSPTHTLGSLVSSFWVKSTKILCQLAKQNYFQSREICGYTKKVTGKTTNSFFLPFVVVAGS
jgi:hypothetical protein